MDFWGFEGKYNQELPGDGYGLFEVPAPTPQGPPPLPNGAAAQPPPPPRGADIGTTTVPGTGGAAPTVQNTSVQTSAPFNAIRTANHTYMDTFATALGSASGITYNPSSAAMRYDAGEYGTWANGAIGRLPGDQQAAWRARLGTAYVDPAHPGSGILGDAGRINAADREITRVNGLPNGTAAERTAKSTAITTAADGADGVVRDLGPTYTPAAPAGGAGSPAPTGTGARGQTGDGPPPPPGGGGQQQYYVTPDGVAHPIAQPGYADRMAAIQNAGLATSGALGGIMSVPMTALGGANVINAQARALSDQGGYSSFGMGGGGMGFGAAAGPFGSSFGMGGFGGVGDLTGTGFMIGSQGGDERAQSQRFDALLRMLMMMIASGNTDAINSAMTVLTAKAKRTLCHVALHVTECMRQTDIQLRQLSDQIGGLAQGPQGQGQSGQASLGYLNSQFQLLSSQRQPAMDMLRNVMSGVEEIESANKSVQDAMLRSKARYAQWT